jgi:predicted transcriptional regulator
MEHLWNLEKAMKDLLRSISEKKPKTTTVATAKRMIDKDFVAYTEFGNSRYYPLVKKTAYFSKHVNGLIKNFFNDSASQFASFFTNETILSERNGRLKKIVDSAQKKNDRL